MKKMFISLLILLLVSGCTASETASTDSQQQETTYTVTFINGYVRTDVEVKEGELVEPIIVEPGEDKLFYCWVTGSKHTQFDFSTPITQDIVLHAVLLDIPADEKEDFVALVNEIKENGFNGEVAKPYIERLSLETLNTIVGIMSSKDDINELWSIKGADNPNNLISNNLSSSSNTITNTLNGSSNSSNNTTSNNSQNTNTVTVVTPSPVLPPDENGHVHDFKPVYKTVHHDDEYENVLVQEAYCEYEIVQGAVICDKGITFPFSAKRNILTGEIIYNGQKDAITEAENFESQHLSDPDDPYYLICASTSTYTDDLHPTYEGCHDAVYEYRLVKAAYDEQVIDHYECDCGETY